jgi:hypothetical protein
MLWAAAARDNFFLFYLIVNFKFFLELGTISFYELARTPALFVYVYRLCNFQYFYVTGGGHAPGGYSGRPKNGPSRVRFPQEFWHKIFKNDKLK